MNAPAPVKVPAMRDALIDRLRQAMEKDDRIFFLCADFGSPALDRLQEQYPKRFLNVGIAEQNLMNVSAGLALEGFRVYAYAIAVFATLRCYEQIRVNLAILSQERPMSVNIIGVGAGVSYDVSGPTHHCLEDLTVMRLLPNVDVTSPADHVTTEAWVDFTLKRTGISYVRLDSKPQPVLPNAEPMTAAQFEKGFRVVHPGQRVAVVTTGYMTQKALRLQKRLAEKGVDFAVVDVFRLSQLDETGLRKTLAGFPHIISLEEGLNKRGGLDRLVMDHATTPVHSMGFPGHYHFDIGPREYIHEMAGVGEEHLAKAIQERWG